jgi:hypothetical protein
MVLRMRPFLNGRQAITRRGGGVKRFVPEKQFPLYEIGGEIVMRINDLISA